MKQVIQILFLSDGNGHLYRDPDAWLIALSEDITDKELDECSLTQLGAERVGGHINHILTELRQRGVTSEELARGPRSDFPVDIRTYKLISGNY